MSSSESNVQINQPDPCSVCLEPMTNDNDDRTLVTLRCGHQFHLDCIGSAYNGKNRMECPFCRNVEKGRWLCVNDGASSSANSVASSSVNSGAPSFVNAVAASSGTETLLARAIHFYDQIGVPPPGFQGPIVVRENHVYREQPPPTPYVPHLMIGIGNRGDGASSSGQGRGSRSREDGANRSGGDGGTRRRGDGGSSSGRGDGGSSRGRGGGSSRGGDGANRRGGDGASRRRGYGGSSRGRGSGRQWSM